MIKLAGLALLATSILPAFTGEADVVEVDISCTGDSICRFDVTVRHDGEVLATRELAHPHDDEQPFTRSLGDVRIPPGLSEVVVRAHDLVHEYGGKVIAVQLPK